MKRVRISNSSINSYGTRVLTSGLDTTQYERNPVLLYMHQRGNVVGFMKDIRVEGDEVTGEPVFDEATPLSVQLKKQMEVGSVRMVSASVDILEMSDEPAQLFPGQRCPTITKSSLFEVSVVDIGSNKDSLVLTHQGKTLNLMGQGDNPLPLLEDYKNNTQTTKQEDTMEVKQIALALGMAETSDEAAVMKKLGELSLAAQQVQTLQQEKEQLQLAAITSTVETAIKEKLIDEGRRQQFIDLGKQIGQQVLDQTFQAMHPQMKLSAVIGHHGFGTQVDKEWQKLSDVPADKLLELRADNPQEYHRLYKAEYGMDF